MLKLQPIQKMRDYTETEMDWEYEVEFLKYCQGRGWFVDAFSSREDFGEKVAAAPLVHLTVEHLRALENSMASAGIGRDEAWVHRTFSHRRDSVRIIAELKMGLTAPPIVFRVSDGRFHLLAGQTRLAAGAALGISVPVKMIDFDNGQRPPARSAASTVEPFDVMATIDHDYAESFEREREQEQFWGAPAPTTSPEPPICETCNAAFREGEGYFTTKTGVVHFPKCLSASPEPDAVRDLAGVLAAELAPKFDEFLNNPGNPHLAADLRQWFWDNKSGALAALSRPAHGGNDAG